MESPVPPPPMMWGPEYGQDGFSGPVYTADAGGAATGVYGVYGPGRQVSGARAVGREEFGGPDTGLEYPREQSGLGQGYEDEEEEEEGEEDSEDELQAGDVYVRTRR
jgi:hypothetical protein